MIFEALKLLHVCNKNNLMVEELFILQTIYDYQTNVSELKKDYVKELEKNYLEYYAKFSGKYDVGGMYEKDISWKNYIEKLIRDGWIEDYRRNKNSFKLSELRVSEEFYNVFVGDKSDEELFEIAMSIYPNKYITPFGTTFPNFNFTTKERKDLFEEFKKKVLSGNRKAKWNEFLMITASLYENPEDFSQFSSMKFDKYITTFYQNLEYYKTLI
jgi:hypothetical protein